MRVALDEALPLRLEIGRFKSNVKLVEHGAETLLLGFLSWVLADAGLLLFAQNKCVGNHSSVAPNGFIQLVEALARLRECGDGCLSATDLGLKELWASG